MSVVKVGPDDFEELAEVWEASVRATHDFLSEADIRELRSLLPVRYLPAVELRCLRAVSYTHPTLPTSDLV